MSADEFEMWDGAYVLGSLTAVERERFEDHLETCDACMLRVAEIWQLPRFLDRAPVWGSESTSGQGELSVGGSAGSRSLGAPMPDAVSERTLAHAHAHARTRTVRRGRWARMAATGTAVAACFVGLGVFALIRSPADPASIPPQAVTMKNVAAATPLMAEVQIVSRDSWDQVNLWCTYGKDQPFRGSYQAVAYGTAGESQVVGFWPAIPGQTVVMRTPTTFHTGTIRQVAILTTTGHTLASTDVRH